ncbi:hypothetical protein TNCV_1707511 [Trichonephila clavipes]|uniref:Uncharacterized protein n=1 Tax=Trichonephila clavipes TaxID=2585209 RepID=A0A8X6RL82_TRICX|nr:hypothetical protein TNCV_1707511 [Trichonephila clavipes]
MMEETIWISMTAYTFYLHIEAHCKLVRVILTLHYIAVRWQLEMELVKLNHGQVTRMIPELTSPSPNDHTNRERLNLERYNVHRAPLRSESSTLLGSKSRYASEEFVTFTIRLMQPRNSF